MTTPLVIKLSGKALEATDSLDALFKAFHSCDRNIVIVHGGGVETDAMLEAMGLKSMRIDGLRVSPKEHMPYITASLAGMCNRQLQSMLVKHGHRTVGLTCTDDNMLTASVLDAKYGCVGTVRPCDDRLPVLLLNSGIIPVISSIAIASDGSLLNINADDVANAVAALLSCPLIYLSDVNGVLDENGALIEEIDSIKAQILIEKGIVKDGMAVKLRAALKASSQTGCRIIIASYKSPSLLSNLSSLRRLGTAISA